MTIPVKFYILKAGQVSDLSSSRTEQARLLDFVCKLTQKVQKSTEQQLVIVDDDISRLIKLNEELWSFTPSSFIPHEMFIEGDVNHDTDVDVASLAEYEVEALKVQDLTAPVTLVNKLPDGFTGIVLNLTHNAQKLGQLNQILEIITSDKTSTEKGREKVHYYRGFDTKVDFHHV